MIIWWRKIKEKKLSLSLLILSISMFLFLQRHRRHVKLKLAFQLVTLAIINQKNAPPRNVLQTTADPQMAAKLVCHIKSFDENLCPEDSASKWDVAAEDGVMT